MKPVKKKKLDKPSNIDYSVLKIILYVKLKKFRNYEN